MTPFRVTHEADGTRFPVPARAPSAALEIVTPKLGDAEGASAWDAIAEAPEHPIEGGVR